MVYRYGLLCSDSTFLQFDIVDLRRDFWPGKIFLGI